MAYYTGSANNVAALLTALRNACTANGYTLAANVLHKGTLFAEVRVGDNGEAGAPTGTMLYVKAGNGIDGGNALTDAAPAFSMIGPLRAATGDTWPDWDWPATYHIHVNTGPDEVWMAVNYGAGAYWQHLAFGQSPAEGNAGTGNWHHAFVPEFVVGGPAASTRRVSGAGISPNGQASGGGSTARGALGGPPFWWLGEQGAATNLELRLNAFIHGAIDSSSGAPIWSHSLSAAFGNSGEGRVSAALAGRPLLSYQPNVGNGYSHLVRIKILQQRPESKTSKLGELGHTRICRNDFINDGQVIGAAPDAWKIYPCYRKNVAARNGGSNIDHSGTVAVAVRYDGS